MLADQMDTLREELNVKEIHFTENPEVIAERIVTVNARALGPRLGGRVQDIIAASKRGEFTIAEDGIHIASEILVGEEASIGYRGREGLAVESADGMVVALDTALTDALILEGRARDLVRAIQDLRKKAGYEVSDRITLHLDNAADILAAFSDYISAEVLASSIVVGIGEVDEVDEVEGVRVGVKRV